MKKIQILGVIFGGLAVLATVVFFFLSLRSKELSFGVVARSTLVDLSEARLADFQVVFRGEDVERVDSLTVRFENSGNLPIEAGDFEVPLVVKLSTGSRILVASVAERTPEDLSPSISTEGNHLSIEPLLLNRGDSFSISLVIDGDPGVPEAEARISGIRRITRIEPPKPPIIQFSVGFGVGVAFFLVLSTLWGWALYRRVIFTQAMMRDMAALKFPPANPGPAKPPAEPGSP